MTSCLAEILVGTNGLASNIGLIEPGLIVAQALKWLPAWVTPLWLLGVGLAAGAILSLAVYGVLSLLSFIPGIGTLADSSRRGVVASLLLGGSIAAVLC